jgi:hypothetical protein
MASIDEYRKQQMMERAGVKPPMPGLVQQAQERRTAFPTNIPARSPYEGSGEGLAKMASQAFPNTAMALRERRADIDAAQKQGGTAAAIGQSLRTAATPLIGFLDDSMTGVKAAINPAAQVLKTFATGDASPIGSAQAAPVTAPKPSTPVLPASAAGAGRGVTNPMVQAATAEPEQPQAKPEAAPTNPLVRQIAHGIYRSGNSYGDSADAAVGGPRGSGQPSAQNMAAADALASRYSGPGMTTQPQAQPSGPQAYIPKDTGGYGLLDKGYRDRRAAMMDAQQMKPGARTALAALLKEQSMANDREAQAEQGAADRQFRQGENAMDRGLRSQELMARMDDSAATRALRAQELQDNILTNAARREAAGVETASAKQMQELRSQYLNAKTDAERNDAARKLQALSGKTGSEDVYMGIAGGQQVIDVGGIPQVVTSAPMILNRRTGEVRPATGQPVGGGQQMAQGPVKIANDAEFDALPKGAIYIGPDGKRYQKP